MIYHKHLHETPIEERSNVLEVPGTPVRILQKGWEFNKLLELYEARQPKSVLELGTAYGGTLYWWLQKATKDTHVVSVDTYSKSEWYGNKDNRDLYSSWIPDGVGLSIVQGRTQDPWTVRTVELYGLYDWIFIDAGHQYEEVKKEWELYSPLVAPGGVVVLHDIYTASDPPAIQEVDKFWAEIRVLGYLTQEFAAVKPPEVTHDGCGLGVVYFP